jgi:hypothetical protein
VPATSYGDHRKHEEVKTEGKRILAKHVNNPQSHLSVKKNGNKKSK